MKKLFHFLLVLIIAISSCKKGDTGAEGSQGAVGVTGPAGNDGTVIMSGTIAPVSSLGNTGDYYLNSTNDSLYGPKTASSWGKAISLKGSKGDTGITGATGATGVSGTDGTDGKTILSGTGAPAITLGNLGDYYLDKTSYVLYGPKFRVILGGFTWGAGLQLGAPVQTYLITNPFDYPGYYPNGIIQIPYSDFNYTAALADNSLSLVYIKISIDSDHNLWFLANGEVGYSSPIINSHYVFSNFESILYIYLAKLGSNDWASLAAFKTGSGLTEIKIIVVPAGKITTISTMPDRSYDKVMDALSSK